MDEDEAALLAELRAISNQSSAGNRFADDDDDEVDQFGHHHPGGAVVEDEKKFNSPPRIQEIQPQKPNVVEPSPEASNLDDELDSLLAPSASKNKQPPPIQSFKKGDAFHQQSTFTGERGGAAEDEELLAELRAISNKSASTDRFASNNDDTFEPEIIETKSTMSSENKRNIGNSSPEKNDIKPWKQKLQNQKNNKPWRKDASRSPKHSIDDNDDVIVAAPPRKNHNANADSAVFIGGGGNFKQESTFTGDRGGAAEDEELLAELRAISAKSSGMDRFAGKDDDAEVCIPISESTMPAAADKPAFSEPTTKAVSQSRPNNEIPSESQQNRGNNDDVEPAEREETRVSSKASAGGAGNFKQESTFAGERGGAAEDEELLALLKGVSAKSGAGDRFSEDDGEANTVLHSQEQTVSDDVVVQSKPSPRRSQSKAGEVKPWEGGKRQSSKISEEGIDVVVASPKKQLQQPDPVDQTASSGGQGNFKQDSTFSGERGGAANDEELLALLKGVSAKSGAADRFSGDEIPATSKEQVVVADTVVQSKPSKPSRGLAQNEAADADKPWKRGNRQAVKTLADTDHVVAAAAPPQRQQQAEPELPIKEEAIVGGAGNFKQESTFNGERGGAAQDEDLLALLRGVSANSGAAHRFSNNDLDAVEGAPASLPRKSADQDVVVQSRSAPRKESETAKPWKRKTPRPEKTQKDVDVVVAAAPPPSRSQPDDLAEKAAIAGGRGNFKQESTFSGERGGAAEDKELLALLKGVSNKSGGADRFAAESSPQEEPSLVHAPAKTKAKLSSKPKAQDASKQMSPQGPLPAEPKGNFQSNSTFAGERGGAAEDPELLALLRGVSSQSGGDRFADDGENSTTSEAINEAKPERQVARSPHKTSITPLPMGSSSGGGDDAVVITNENLPTSIEDKDWKVRKAAYLFLNDMIETAGGNNPTGELDGNSVFSGVDELVVSFLMDKNANALDGALGVCLSYADYCVGGTSSECARRLTTALIKGNGFTSSRPTAAKTAKALVIKLMEVGSSAESLKGVVGVLLDLGVTSRKPKIVQVSSSLILESAFSFGAACLPIAAVSEALPKLLAHSSKPVRDTALEIVAELCRALGSKDPMNGVIEKMKKAQVKDLDALLEKQPASAPLKVGFRAHRGGGGGNGVGGSAAEDVLAALHAGAKELEAEKFAKRPAVNLMETIKKTDYAAKLKLAKWSEKVAGLKIIIECAGEQPYKLAQPSSSCNYVPLVHEMKGVLTHTHYLVVSKAMEVLAMLAEGVGEKLYPNLRPLLPTLLSLSKDKKLVKGISSCLDALFGNVLGFEHLLDTDAALPEAVQESKTKNALARAAALDFLGRCIDRRDSAGPRSSLKGSTATSCGNLCAEKLNDSDANVRKSSLAVLKALQNVDDPDVKDRIDVIIGELENSNPRAFKSLAGSNKKTAVASKSGVSSPSRQLNMPPTQNKESPARELPRSKPESPKKKVKAKAPINPFENVATSEENSDGNFPDLETAASRCASLAIPNWDAEDDEGGVRAGVESTNWKYRFEALKALASFVSSREVLESASDVEMDTACILVFVKEHTRGFKETNVNVTKGILELFLALCDYHEQARLMFPKWAGSDGARAAVEKIADKKLAPLSKNLLLSLCVVQAPDGILESSFTAAGNLKSPVAHEEFLKWFKSFCNEFGAASIGPGIYTAVGFLIEFTKARNVRVNKAAYSALGTMHTHLGPAFQAVALKAAEKDQSLRDQLDKTFNEHPHDRSAASSDWPKKSLSSADNNPSSSDGGGGISMEVPKMNLMSELPDNILVRMGSKEGKTAWKARKAAMEDIESAMTRCTGLLDTSLPRPLVGLLRALKERLSDSQSNLKPVAARLIGLILSSLDRSTQARMGKIVYSSLINTAMNDNKKIMHDAAMEALRIGTALNPLEGDGPNEQSLEAFVIALVGELEESEFKAGGIADVLHLTRTFTVSLPNLDEIASQRGETLGGRFSRALVDALSSSKSDTRGASEALIFDCIEREVFSVASVKKSVSRLKPAKQRSLGAMMANLSSVAGEDKAADSTEERSSLTSASMVKLSSTDRSDRGTKPKSAMPMRSSSRRVTETRGAYTQAQASRTKFDGHHSVSASNHPLVSNSTGAGLQKARSAMKLLTWPEYPEEPSGNTLLNGLKKAWAPLIPPESLNKIFPDGGIRKQDDAAGGCELLSRAIALERAGDGCAIVEQFNLILKWAAFVLCCKESPVGLQALLTFLSDLFDFLRESKYELSDSETLQIVPLILDKASVAKGRFKDSFADIVEQIKSEDLLPPKRMGPIVCVSLIEASSHPKAILIACNECYDCVEKIGLSGIGKKGVIATAKALSEAKLNENKSALLELMTLVLARMNGDMQRLSRICGSSLSSKARDLLEERAKKTENGVVGIPRSGIPTSSSSNEAASSRRTSRLPASSRMTPGRRPLGSSMRNNAMSPRAGRSETPKERTEDLEHVDEVSSNFCDELPALDLRAGLRDTPSAIPRPNDSSKRSPALTPTSKLASPRVSRLEEPSTNVARSLSFNGGDGSFEYEDIKSSFSWEKPSEKEIGASLSNTSSLDYNDNGTKMGEPSLGAAASLRARLMKIREKNKVPTEIDSDNHRIHDIQEASVVNALPPALSSETPTSESPLESSSSPANIQDEEDIRLENELDALLDDEAEENSHGEEVNKLDAYLNTIKAVLARDTPVQEDDQDVIASTDVLKSIHAAVSKQANLAVGLDASAVARLREDIKARANEVISILTSLIDFGFNCHPKDCNAGISVPLLSVNLAGLMAIFRSDDLSKMAEVADLTILIKEAGRALLDPRLGSSGSALDEATSTQMVRAINKLAVQAATGTTRHVAFQALIALQLQLTTGTDGLDDTMYRSRLSRVVTKLFMRVVKAEESTFKPFSSASLDVEALLCCLEDSLVACQKVVDQGLPDDGIEASQNLARVLVLALMRERGDASTLLLMMEELEIDTYASSLGALMSSCSAELGYSYTKPARGADRDVSALVSAVGSARDGPERDLAVDALRQYTDTHGNDGLNTHLAEVSSTFRAFILEQLDGSSSEKAEETSAKSTTSSMSERIKNLRSKITATEAVVQSAVDPMDGQFETNKALVKPAPPKPSNSATESQDRAVPPSVRAFRERLALAQSKRTLHPLEPEDDADPPPSNGNRAAALRARLQAVKKQAGQSQIE